MNPTSAVSILCLPTDAIGQGQGDGLVPTDGAFLATLTQLIAPVLPPLEPLAQWTNEQQFSRELSDVAVDTMLSPFQVVQLPLSLPVAVPTPEASLVSPTTTGSQSLLAQSVEAPSLIAADGNPLRMPQPPTRRPEAVPERSRASGQSPPIKLPNDRIASATRGKAAAPTIDPLSQSKARSEGAAIESAALYTPIADPTTIATTDKGPATPPTIDKSLQSLSTAIQPAAPNINPADALGVKTPALVERALLHQQVGSARWADELGTRITMMATQGQQQASLRLSPEHLGPVEIRISITQDTANIWFGAQHADTRAALQDALPRLRELLETSGLSMGQTNVSHEAPRQHSRDSDGFQLASGDRKHEVSVDISTPAQQLRIGMLDTYA
jgi:flagellar hook-length control protein FliK